MPLVNGTSTGKKSAAGYDMYFMATKSPKSERVDGNLHLNGVKSSYTACSGSRTLLPLPNGIYSCTNPRQRPGVAAMAGTSKDGKEASAWSIDLTPEFSTDRTQLRIHPDGNHPGTAGCIGILQGHQQCYEDILRLFENKQTLRLLVCHTTGNLEELRTPPKEGPPRFKIRGNAVEMGRRG